MSRNQCNMDSAGAELITGGHLPNEAVTMLSDLRQLVPTHLRLLKDIHQTGFLYHVDLVVIAAGNRSISLIEAFCTLVEALNPIAALPLIRLQIDSVLRVNACRLVNKSEEVGIAMLENKPLNKIKSRTGHSLTDAYLYKEAAGTFPWIPEVYKQTSGFVHLSGRHITAPITSLNDADHSFSMVIGPTSNWREADLLEAIMAFGEATTSLLGLFQMWLNDKVEHFGQPNHQE